MTDSAIIAASYAAERNYSHTPDDVIDASDAVGAWGTAKESTTELVDLSGEGNIATIHGAMPTEGFIQGRRYDGDDDYINCGNDSSLKSTDIIRTGALIFPTTIVGDNRRISGMGSTVSYELSITNGYCVFNVVLEDVGRQTVTSTTLAPINKYIVVEGLYDGTTIYLFINGESVGTPIVVSKAITNNTDNYLLGRRASKIDNHLNGVINYAYAQTSNVDVSDNTFFNTLARLPFWSIDYEDYPDNVTTYTDNLPYSSSIISSGTFKVDDDVLNCVSAGTITYRASYEFDGSEYIKVEIGGVEYAGTGTITQGNTTVSVAQGSNKVTIQMGTADTINKVRIQFREEV